MGTVYRAEPLAGGEAVALKIVSLTGAGDSRAVRRFEREAASGARIGSPYVARTLDSGRVGERWGWLAMEYAEGVSLDELGPAGATPRIEPRAARRLLSQLFSALSAAHREGIVHRDLKPENLRVARGGDALELKVLDFGIAKDLSVSTLSGTTPGLGTPLWAAPEQGHQGYRPSPRADVWSLGLLTFFVLTGHVYWQNAHERASMADLAIELVQDELAPAGERCHQLGLEVTLPPGFDAWFNRTVNRDAKERFPDAAEAWRALEPLLDAAAAGVAPAAVPVAAAARAAEQAARGERERDRAGAVRPGGFLTAVIAGVITMGLAIYWLLRSMHI